MKRSFSVVRAAALVAAFTVAAACRPGFQPRNYSSTGALFKASLAEYNKKNFDNAVTGFERLTLDLSARDTLLPMAHWYLANAHEAKKEHLLAASSFARLAESYPDDSLAPIALFRAGESYSALWRKPDLDATYGDLAQIQYRQLASIYPDSPMRKQADNATLQLDEKKAMKDYLVGMHYVRRGGYESSLIYFKDVVRNYPNTRVAHDALMEMVVVYRRPELKYVQEATETCATLRTAYAGEAAVAALCPGVASKDSVGVKPTGPTVPKPAAQLPGAPKKPPLR
jgi:outer membrane assembly lipoprotein YfiO